MVYIVVLWVSRSRIKSYWSTSFKRHIQTQLQTCQSKHTCAHKHSYTLASIVLAKIIASDWASADENVSFLIIAGFRGQGAAD